MACDEPMCTLRMSISIVLRRNHEHGIMHAKANTKSGNMHENSPVESFVKSLLEEKGVLDVVDETVRQELVATLTHQLEKVINRNLLNELDDDQLIEFNHALDNNFNIDESSNFFYNKGIDVRRVVARSFQQFRDAYLRND